MGSSTSVNVAALVAMGNDFLGAVTWLVELFGITDEALEEGREGVSVKGVEYGAEYSGKKSKSASWEARGCWSFVKS